MLYKQHHDHILFHGPSVASREGGGHGEAMQDLQVEEGDIVQDSDKYDVAVTSWGTTYVEEVEGIASAVGHCTSPSQRLRARWGWERQHLDRGDNKILMTRCGRTLMHLR